MNPSTRQATVIVDELVRGGVREAVLCPGSRNAPLAFALHAAERAGRLRLHVRIDERSAGYLAVGLAVAGGAPVPVVMTSGTAVANVSPAVFEANYARVPLIVLSANRPYELLGSGANQTVEQFGLFGSQVRLSVSPGVAEDAVGADAAALNSRWRSAVTRALAAARGARTGNAGPVQFDVPLREPLVPGNGSPTPDVAWAGRADGGPWTATPMGRLTIPVPIDLTPDTVVIAGHGAGPLPELAELPTVAEPTAPRPQNPLRPQALRNLRPQQAIIAGRPTLHREVSAVLADPAVRVYALTTGPRWPDVSGNVIATGTTPEVGGAPTAQWLEAAAAQHERVTDIVRTVLEESPTPTGVHVAATVAAVAKAGDQLVLGASNPVRDIAIAADLAPGVVVRSNRGVAGIDGTVATAIGAALAHPGRTIALLGDLTFLHDVGALLLGPEEPRPTDLTIVVANDEGGGIFEVLEQGAPAYRDTFERAFGTPHRADFAALCAGYGIPHHRSDLADLPGVLATPAQGIRVVEVRTHRDGLRDLHQRIRERTES